MKSENEPLAFEGPNCPLPLQHTEKIVMGHGSGGKMTQKLIEDVFYKEFKNELLESGNDFASVALPSASGLNGRIAISTDSHIITPLIYPGSDIGRLAICGTVNDVAMSGAKPLYITAGFILEEGFPFETLERIVLSMQEAAREAGVQIVAGDTKVAEKGKVDGIYINTTGIGWIPGDVNIGGQFARPGDAVLISGTLGDHGIAVLAARGELGLEIDLNSDTAPLNNLIQDVLQAAPHTHVLRDPTRGGLATSLNEIARQSKVNILINEENLPVKPSVQAACEMLGFDPLYIANEGKVIVILPQTEAQAALAAMRKTTYGKDACQIGVVSEEPAGRVLVKTALGSKRILDVLTGELLPRIC